MKLGSGCLAIAALVWLGIGACSKSNTATEDAGVAGSGTAGGGAAGSGTGGSGGTGSGTGGSSGIGSGTGASGGIDSGTGGSGGAGSGTGGSAGIGSGTGGSGGIGSGTGGSGGAGSGTGGSGGIGSGTGGGNPGGTGGAGTTICDLAFEPGPCDAAFPVFAYDAESGVCQRRIYGGCDGNENRFDTLVECQAACVDDADVTCEADADCGWGEIGHDILVPSDCICLFGCPYIPLNLDTIERRQAQYQATCQPGRDGTGEPCPIDDCALPAPAMCVDGKCTGDPFGGF